MTSNDSISHDDDMTCYMPTRWCDYSSTSWFMSLIWYLIHLLASLKYCCPLWLIITWFSMWWWHGMLFGNKLSQNFMVIHDFLWHHNFFVCLEFMAPIFVMACHNVLCAMKFLKPWIHACVCVLNNLFLTCNYDYNINNFFKNM